MKLDSLLRLPSDLEKVGLTVDWFLIYQPRQKAFGNNVERQLIIKKTSMKLSKQHWKIPYFPGFFLLNCWNGIIWHIVHSIAPKYCHRVLCVWHFYIPAWIASATKRLENEHRWTPLANLITEICCRIWLFIDSKYSRNSIFQDDFSHCIVFSFIQILFWLLLFVAQEFMARNTWMSPANCSVE